MVHNLSKCRLCLKLGNFYSIFTEDNNLQLADMVMECAQIEICIDDRLPDKICSECIQKLSSAYIFKKQCERSDQELRRHYAPLQTLNSSMPLNWSNSPENIISSQNKSPSFNNRNTLDQTHPPNSNSTCIATKLCLPKSSTKKAKKVATVLLKTKSTTNRNLRKQPKKDLKLNNIIENSSKKSLVSQTSISYSRTSKANDNVANITSTTDAQDIKYNLKCEKCNETFKLNIMLKRHLKKCSKSRTSLQEIQASPQQLVNFSCEICTAKFRTMDNLQKHMRVVHMTILKEDCHQSKDEILKYNMPCFYCHVPFYNYTTYCAHFNSCSKSNYKSNFECPKCNKIITGKSSFFVHIKTFHFEPQEENKVKVDSKISFYMCCLCNKTLPTPELLRMHLKGHQSKSKETNIR